MVYILFVGGIKIQQALENNYFIASYNLFHQEVGNMPPSCPSTIFEGLMVHTSKSEVSGKFPHVRIIVLDLLNDNTCIYLPKPIPPHPQHFWMSGNPDQESEEQLGSIAWVVFQRIYVVYVLIRKMMWLDSACSLLFPERISSKLLL